MKIGRFTLFEDFASISAIKIASIICGLAVSALLARSLGPEKFGSFSFIISLISVFSVSIVGGICPLATREIAIFKHRNQQDKLNGIAAISLLWIAVSSLAIFVFFNFSFNHHPLYPFFKIAIILIPFGGIIAICSSIMRGLGSPVYSELSSNLLQPIFVLALLFFTISNLSIHTTIIIHVISAALTSFCCIFLALKIWPNRNFLHVNAEPIRWLKLSIPFTLMALTTVINSELGVIVLGLTENEKAVAGMRIAQRGAIFVALPLAIINSIIAHKIVDFKEKDNIEGIEKLCQNTAKTAFIFSSFIFILFLCFGKFIISAIYGEDYILLCFVPLIIVSLSQVFSSFMGSVGNLLSMTNNELSLTKFQFISAILNLALCLILIPYLDQTGAALATGLSIIALNVLAYYKIKRLYGINVSVLSYDNKR